MISLIHPHTCGFAKAAAWEFTRAVVTKITRDENATPKQHQQRIVQEIFTRFSNIFADTETAFRIDLPTFQRKLPQLRKKFSTWNSRKSKERQQYLEAFGLENWKKLTTKQKAEHSLMDCQGCFHRYSVYQSLFPVCSKEFKGSVKRSPVVVAQDLASNINTNPPPVKATSKECQQAARKINDVLSPVFEKVYNVPLATAFTMVKNLNLQAKKSKAEKKKERRDCYRKAKQAVEAKWKETEVVRQVPYPLIMGYVP